MHLNDYCFFLVPCKTYVRSSKSSVTVLYCAIYSAPEQESNVFGFKGFHTWGQQQRMCMYFDGTQVKHYYVSE